VVAVAIVVTIYTAGAAAEAFGAAEVGGSTLATGAAALGGTLTATGAGIAGAVVGGIAGSVAGQLTGDALGVSQGFSLEQALTSGLAAGLTAGIGAEISGSGGVLANANGTLRPAGAALFGAGAYASGVAAANVTGQAEHFSWAGLAASAVGSGLTAAAGLDGEPLQQVGDSAGSFTQDVARGLLSGGLTRETSQLLGDNHVSSWQQIGEDAFGNALGNAVVRAYQPANPATAYNPNNDTLLKYAQGYQNDVAFEQQAQSDMDSSPILLASNSALPSLADTVYGRPMSTDGSWPSSESDPAASADGDHLMTVMNQPFTSLLALDAYGNPAQINGLDVTNLQQTQVTVSTSSDVAPDYSNYFPTSSLNAIDQQLQDVLPGSKLWQQLQQQKATQGLMSSDPGVVANANLAAMELHIGQVQQEVQYGGRPMSTVEDATPSLLAHQAQQRQLNAAFAPLVGSVLLTGMAAGAVEPMPMEALPMDRLEPTPQENMAGVSGAFPSTGPTLDGNTQGLVNQLRTATLTGGDTATPARALADLSTNVSGDGSRVVLGQWNSLDGGYINEAQTNGGIWFQTPNGVYEGLTQGLSAEQGRAVVWNVNQQFLQSNLENGVSEFNLWNETPEDVLINRPNSYTASEVNYLQQNAGRFGYTRQGSSWMKGQ